MNDLVKRAAQCGIVATEAQLQAFLAQPAAALNPAGMGVLIALTKEKNKLHAALELACNYLTDEQAAEVAAAMPDEAAPAQAAAVPEVEELKGLLRSAITALEVLQGIAGLQPFLPGLPGLIERSKEAVK